MSPRQIVTAAPRAPVVHGESLVARTVFLAGDDAPWEVPSPDARSPLVYTVTPAGGGDVTRLSLDGFLLALRGEPGDRPSPPETVTLAPGARLLREQEIGDLDAQPIAPGEHMLRAHYDVDGASMTSPPSRLRVVTPRVVSAMSAPCPRRGGLVTAMWHRDGDRHTLFARESYPGNPAMGVMRRLATREGDAPRDVSVFLDAADLVGGRWIAWCHDGRLEALRAWGPTVDAEVSLASTWTSLRVVGPGYQQADTAGHAVVVGARDGRPRAACVRLHPDGASTLWEISLPSTPELVTASHDDRGRQWLFWTSGDAAYALSAVSSPAPKVMSLRTLGGLRAPAVACQAPPWLRAGRRVFTALEGPTDDLSARAVTLSLEGHDPVVTDLGAAPITADRWVVVTAPDGAPRVLVAAAGDVYLLVEGAPWRRLGPLDEDSPWVSAWETSRGAAWVEWCDPDRGVRRAPL